MKLEPDTLKRMVRDVLKQLRSEGVTVFLNSHLLSEVEVTCTRAAFIARGQVKAIRDLSAGNEALLRLDIRVDTVDDGLMRGLGQWGQDVTASDGVITMELASRQSLPDIARWIVGRGTDLFELSPRDLSLEDLFVSIVEGEG